MKNRLKEEATEPIGTVDLACFRLVDMFCACTTAPVKNTILLSFYSPSIKLRVVVTTIALVMAFDYPNVRRVIHLGPFGDIELNLQETRRAGRDELEAFTVLYDVTL